MILRPLTINDIDFLLEVRNDDTTRVFLENDSQFTRKQCIEWFEITKPQWLIIEVDNKSVGYLRTNGDEVGCDIHPNFRKKGFARKAYNEYLRDKSYATLWVFNDNFAKNLYVDLGFKEDGTQKIIRGRKYVRMIYNKE